MIELFRATMAVVIIGAMIWFVANFV